MQWLDKRGNLIKAHDVVEWTTAKGRPRRGVVRALMLDGSIALDLVPGLGWKETYSRLGAPGVLEVVRPDHYSPEDEAALRLVAEVVNVDEPGFWE